MGDTGGHPSHRAQAVAHAHFPFQPADLRQIGKTIDVAEHAMVRNPQLAGAQTEDFFSMSRGQVANRIFLRWPADRGHFFEKQLVNLFPHDFRQALLEEFFSRWIKKIDLAAQISGDQPAAHGIDDVLVQGLQAFQCLHILLPQLGAQVARQKSDGEVCNQIHRHHDVQRAVISAWRNGIRMQPAEVGGLQGSAKENECQTR